MKFTLFLYFVCLLHYPADNLQPVIQSFKTFDVEKISAYFDDNVEVSILEDSILANKLQAKLRLKQFFKEQSVKSLKVVHQIQSKNGCSGSFIANMNSPNKRYRLFVLITVAENKKLLIQEINIREK